jgi:uncharacterized membrane protein
MVAMAQTQKLSQDEIIKWRKKLLTASVMRIAGMVFIIFGIVMLTNMFNIARILGLHHDNVHAIFGLFLFMIGVFDTFIVPQLILRRPKKKS